MRLAATHFSTINTAYDLHNIILYSWNFSDFIDSGSNTLIKGATEVQHPGFEPATLELRSSNITAPHWDAEMEIR